MAKGCCLTASVKVPPASEVPNKRCTASWSLYSDMSNRIKASGDPNMAWASCLAVSVLPVPGMPKNRNELMGLVGSWNPAKYNVRASKTP